MSGKWTVRVFGAGVALAAVLAVACSQTRTAESKKAEAKPAGAKPAAVFGYLQTRDHRITIQSNGLFTIADKAGKVLAENVSLKELQASNPRLHEILERAVAKGKGTLDARVTKGDLSRDTRYAPHNDASLGGIWKTKRP